uniref:uncharacterized protein LOC124058709 n=1 Tax=Scatophagus argus TaxID=75038 RepID=UPI001ED7EF09|nr:uncharacterized protein LOC124058709 [Scatophagus argus]
MLTRWLTFTAFLAGSASPGRAAVTVAPACRVEGHPEAQLTLNCGDGTNAGVVQYWHTPFGDLHRPGFHSKLDPVFMHQDGSLVVPNASVLHGGWYYCLLQHTEGTALWPYKLHISPDTQKNQEHGQHERRSSCDAFRCRRDVGSEAERQAAVSDGQFAGAVTASVLLTFVLGFSAGALARTQVLRCLGAVTKRLQSPRRRRQTDTPDHDPEVTMTNLPSMYNNQVFEAAQTESPISSTASSPPAKPQRSFRTKRHEEQEAAAYLEGCNYMEEEEGRMEEEEEKVERRSLEDSSQACDGETAEDEAERKFYLLEDEGSQSETDEDKFSEGGGDKEETKADEEESKSEEGGEGRRKREEEEEEDDKEKEGDDGENMRREEDAETDTCSKDDEMDGKKQEDTMERGGDLPAASSLPRPRRRSRVIRLYQYDDEGQRYCHLPDPVPDEPGPAPRLKHRSVSLTRLNAIMDTASGGPLNSREAAGEERLHFHMDI